MTKLLKELSHYWLNIQGSLFPWLKEELGPLTEKRQQLVMILEVVRVEDHIPSTVGLLGRPPADRAALARAFVAKAVYNLSTTRALLDRLESDIVLRRLCGWEKKAEVPSESTFSRAFDEFARTQFAERVHQALIEKTQQERLVGHIARDSTEIEVREKPMPKPKPKKVKGKRGRLKKGQKPVKERTRLQRQGQMRLSEMLQDLPQVCDVGTKRNSKGHQESWVGYKLHLDVADGQIPICCILTSASLHDSQVAIPLATMTAQRTTNLYDLMDSAYDASEIKVHSRSLDHVPIIDLNPRGNAALQEELNAETQRLEQLHFQLPEAVRYRERSAVERVYGRLKDEFGGRLIRVRGYAKVLCHLMFGILALTADQLMRLAT
jgi:transposase